MRIWESEEYFNYQGIHFKMSNFYLYTKPKNKIPIIFAAQRRKAAVYSGIYGDHLATVTSPMNCRDVIFLTFEEPARKVGRDSSKMNKMIEIPPLFRQQEGDRH